MRVAQVGAAGLALLDAVLADDAQLELRSLPAIELAPQGMGPELHAHGGRAALANDRGWPATGRSIHQLSTYDPEAHVAVKHATAWMGTRSILRITANW